MKERLLKIIMSEGLSPSLLADEMGVQRSGISHILSGRNYPSYDFLQKILVRFPKLNAEWLILGQGPMYKSTVTVTSDLFTNVEIPEESFTTPNNSQNISCRDDNEQKISEPVPEKLSITEVKKAIEKIIVFQTDKTFAVYFPE